MLLIDKPAGITSHDVVSEARRALRTRRINVLLHVMPAIAIV
jgi:tRNA U55 pseudouridine synthase TruB